MVVKARRIHRRSLHPWLYDFLGQIVSDDLIREAHSIPLNGIAKLPKLPRDSFTVTEKGAGPPKSFGPF